MAHVKREAFSQLNKSICTLSQLGNNDTKAFEKCAYVSNFLWEITKWILSSDIYFACNMCPA